MKKKLIAGLLATAMVATMLTGCGSSSSGSTSTESTDTAESTEAAADESADAAESTDAAETTTVADGEDPQLEKSFKILSIWDQDSDNGELITKIADQYIADVNPNFSYEYEYVSSDDLRTKVATLVSSNDLPDMFAYEAGAPLVDYIEADKVANISELLKTYNCEDALDPSAVSLLKTLSGTDDIYDLPLGLNVEGFWYNKALFEEAGIENPPTTWDEFEEDCQKLQDAGIQPLSAGGSDKWGVTRVINAYLVRTGGADAMAKAKSGEASYTDDVYVAAAAKVQEWADKGWFGEGVNTVDMTTAGQMLMNGQAAMFYNGSWFAENLNDTSANKAGEDGIGFFNVPVADEKISPITEYSMNCGNILCLSKDKCDEATGWFIKYFVEHMGDVAMETQGTVKGYTYTASADAVKPYTQIVLDEIDKATSAFTWFEATLASEVSSVAQEQVQALMTDDITAEEYMQLIQDASDLAN